MSQRSIIEINHDLAHRILDDPVGFVNALQPLLNAGTGFVSNYAGSYKRALDQYGIKAICTEHSDTDRKVVVNGYEYMIP